jgi:hypothetical protein
MTSVLKIKCLGNHVVSLDIQGDLLANDCRLLRLPEGRPIN